MTSRVTPGQLIIPDENLGMNPKKIAADRKGKSSKIIHKKGVAAGSGRKALNDISNKSSILHQEVPIRKKERAKEEIDVAGERFLHDHDKCIEAQRLPVLASYLDLVLPGHDSLPKVESHASDQAKINIDTPRCYSDPDELFTLECNSWEKYLAKQHSAPCSPMHWDSSSASFSWQFEEPNFVLRDE
ncbi:protein PATRONUS 1-like isoform X2 [Momordica charantia]|uniref:Protein PATRONUS 1-like isoform X2 n=1 Tax=Momordica charantia TaxID=3673 RepID=A0A6J1D5A5_MOMCH|nr:protein PATRONUS 1-like isoform X2 [Momordica charantia]